MEARRRSNPKRQTPEDQANEDAILVALAEKLGMDYEPLAEAKYKVDAVYFADDEIPKFVVEVKRRNVKSGDYKEVFLSTHKTAEGLRQSAIHRCPFLFAVQWDDVRMVLSIKHQDADHWKIKMAGMRGRGDVSDYEPCYMIPVKGNPAWREF